MSYTLGAFFLACVATGFFVYLRFQFGLSPLERYYLPYYLRSETVGLVHPASPYQMLYVSDGESPGGLRLRPMSSLGPHLNFRANHCHWRLRRKPQSMEPITSHVRPRAIITNKAIHAWIAHWIYADVPLFNLFRMQLLFGLAAFVLQLPFSIPKDIERIKQLRYGRRLKGPVLVNAKDFTKAVAGTGIGITTNDSKLPLRIPRDAENKHFLIVGDTGIRQVEHHSPDALSSGCARRQRHRL